MDTGSEEHGLDLFAKEMAGVTRNIKNDRILLKCTDDIQPGQQYRKEKACEAGGNAQDPLSMVLRHKLSPDDWLSFKRDGIQTAVFKNLRVGKYIHEANLNLHKKSPAQARDELIEFVNDCEEMNIRSVLIFFGRGEQSCLLKSYLNQWLPELKKVQAFHTAQKHHGGAAAAYVLFRKSEQKRSENRERHAARLGGTL